MKLSETINTDFQRVDKDLRKVDFIKVPRIYVVHRSNASYRDKQPYQNNSNHTAKNKTTETTILGKRIECNPIHAITNRQRTAQVGAQQGSKE